MVRTLGGLVDEKGRVRLPDLAPGPVASAMTAAVARYEIEVLSPLGGDAAPTEGVT